uniref:PglZ domain-containing protein n=1 Tax=Halovenus aranensis TaxID=890420 RepID=UPI0034A179D0
MIVHLPRRRRQNPQKRKRRRLTPQKRKRRRLTPQKRIRRRLNPQKQRRKRRRPNLAMTPSQTLTGMTSSLSNRSIRFLKTKESQLMVEENTEDGFRMRNSLMRMMKKSSRLM